MPLHGFHISILSHDVYSNEQQFALIQPNKLCNLYWFFFCIFAVFLSLFVCVCVLPRFFVLFSTIPFLCNFHLTCRTRGLGTMSSAANTDRIVVHSDIVFIKLECIKCIPLNRHETVSNVRAQCRYIRYRIYIIRLDQQPKKPRTEHTITQIFDFRNKIIAPLIPSHR